MRYFYIEPAALRKTPVAIEGAEVRHIKNVLRLKPGSRICLVDGKGFEYEAVIQRFGVDRVELELRHKRPGKKESPVNIGVAQAMLKAKKMDRLLRQLCELGIARWLPYRSERSVPTPGATQASGRQERWQKIVQESVKQCQRAKLPEICPIQTFEDILYNGQSHDAKIVFYEHENTSLNELMTAFGQKAPKNILLILGPEGGFSNREIEQAQAAGCLIAGLGPRILRAETAAIAACTILQFLLGDMA